MIGTRKKIKQNEWVTLGNMSALETMARNDARLGGEHLNRKMNDKKKMIKKSLYSRAYCLLRHRGTNV